MIIIFTWLDISTKMAEKWNDMEYVYDTYERGNQQMYKRKNFDARDSANYFTAGRKPGGPSDESGKFVGSPPPKKQFSYRFNFIK